MLRTLFILDRPSLLNILRLASVSMLGRLESPVLSSLDSALKRMVACSSKSAGEFLVLTWVAVSKGFWRLRGGPVCGRMTSLSISAMSIYWLVRKISWFAFFAVAAFVLDPSKVS